MLSRINKIPLEDIENIKLRPVIDQTGRYTYNAALMIPNCLKPLWKNDYTINDTQSLSQELSTLPPFRKYEKYVLYVM